MATNLQVTANTQQAVGAFNALAASISNAHGQFNRLAQTAATSGRAAFNSYSQAMTGLNSAFEILSKTVGTFFGILTKVGVGLEFVFSAVIKELDKLQGFNAIMMVTTKSSKDAAASYDFLRKTADNLGVEFESLLTNYSKLLAAIPEGNNRLEIARKTFLGISMAARTLHSTNSDTQLMFYAITQMASKGVVSMEELRRQLGEKLPGVMQIAAKAFNTVPEELEKAIRKGTVNSEKFLAGFSDQLIRTFADSSSKASESVSASIRRLTNVWVDFVKEVMDSGAGNSIVKFFDALREKLSDPYLISRFADLIKYLADKFTGFVKGLTDEDIRNGFDTFVRGIELLINVLGKVIEMINWIINNTGKAGAAMGAIGGAIAGMPLGPWGMAGGAVVGGLGGGYVGSQMGATPDQERKRQQMDQAALAQKEAKLIEQQEAYVRMLPVLSKFVGLKSTREVQPLLEGDRRSQETIDKLVGILSDPRFKTDKDRAQGAIDFAKTGEVLGPNSRQLSDILGPAKAKKGNDGGMMSTILRNNGLDAGFLKDWDNLNKSYKAGKMSVEQLEQAQAKLLSQQPFMEEMARKEASELKKYNKEFNTNKELAFQLVDAREDLEASLKAQERLSGMRGEDLAIEQGVQGEIEKFRQRNLDMTDEEIAKLRDRLGIIQRTKEVTQAMDAVLASTVDKYKGAIIEAQAIQKALSDPTSGLTKEAVADYYVTRDPNAEGSQQYLDAQKRSLEEYYIYVDMLRKNDFVKEETALQMKANAQATYDAKRLQLTSDFFGNMSVLAKSSNNKLSEIGRTAAIAQATVQGYLAVQKALASAPPPYSYVLAAGAATYAAANVAAIINTKGYEIGGYTGNGNRNSIAGVVHGEEFVANALATSRNRSTLEAMNRGAVINENGGGRSVQVEFHNYGTAKDVEVQQIDENRVRLIARDVVNKETPDLVASQISNSNSPISKSMNRHIQGGNRKR